MTKYKNKIKQNINNKTKCHAETRDRFSVQKFKEGLDRGKFEVGSSLFTGTEREVKLIKQICSYLDYKYIKQDKIACCLLDSSTKFNVVHYTVEMINE